MIISQEVVWICLTRVPYKSNNSWIYIPVTSLIIKSFWSLKYSIMWIHPSSLISECGGGGADEHVFTRTTPIEPFYPWISWSLTSPALPLVRTDLNTQYCTVCSVILLHSIFKNKLLLLFLKPNLLSMFNIVSKGGGAFLHFTVL